LLEGWAKIQNNLGSVYCNRIYGYRPENLEEAITLRGDNPVKTCVKSRT